MPLNHLTSSDYDKMHQRLSWYEKVSADRRPAKYRLARRIACNLDFGRSTDQLLWREHEHLSDEARNMRFAVDSEGLQFKTLPLSSSSFLDLKIELLRRIIRSCMLCEWNCRVDRTTAAKLGKCGLSSTSRVSTWFRHFGEEPPLVGRGGSGTVFFSSCNFRCAFCQNWDISQDSSSGTPLEPHQLAQIIKNLKKEGALNINFVGGDPTPDLHTIVAAINEVDVNVPMLWNSNMYCSEQTMSILSDLIDIWLPDFKYGNDRCALRLSGVPHYLEVVARNHEFAHSNGDIVIRHLVMPNHIDCCTSPVLRWISGHCPRAVVNIMGQYHPNNRVLTDRSTYADIDRKPTAEEMQAAYDLADDLGLLYSPVS